MDTGDMRTLLQGYLNELAWAGGLSKETIMGHITERDDDLRTMIEEYIPEGTYEDAFSVMTLIPEQAWQDSQGDQWRGAATQYPKDVETGFAESPVARKEEQDGIVGRGGYTSPADQSSSTANPSSSHRSGQQGQTPHSGQPGDGAGRKERAGSQDSGVFPASGPAPDDPDARYQGMASFGQGERGAAGYQDHGYSEAETIPPDDSQSSKSADRPSKADDTSS